MMIIVLIGPMGCGKTTVGLMLAEKLNCDFDDADDFHPPENIAKMSRGTPLTDEDRTCWLEILAKRVENKRKQNESLVLACSALKRKYRDLLGINQRDVISVYLKGSLKILDERVSSRNHQFMNNDLLLSQLETMEEPSDGLIVDIKNSPEMLVEIIIGKICRDT
jgi:carbohydrate kinase (thermoresistant glucokinase family)